jgi:hypothetical protein
VAGEPVPDYSRLYVRALVVQHALKIGGVYAGLENVAAYTDCLCSALMCALRTWSAVVDLEGALAELVCREGRLPAQAGSDRRRGAHCLRPDLSRARPRP